MSGRFKKGQSGNPAGRPKGSGLTGRLRRAIAEESDDILAGVIEQAKAGDVQAARLLLERIVPAYKPESAPVTVAGMDGAGSLTERATVALEAAANGDLAPDTASALVNAIGTLARVTEIDEIEKRLSALEGEQ